MAKLYEITFSYTLVTEAENAEQAEQWAISAFDETVPRTDEFNVDTKEVTNEQDESVKPVH
jgi:hypothetical protein